MSHDKVSRESVVVGVVIVVIFTLFIGFFYLAVTNEPDYMPSQQKKAQMQMTEQHQTTIKE